jgi:hypothetical protein
VPVTLVTWSGQWTHFRLRVIQELQKCSWCSTSGCSWGTFLNEPRTSHSSSDVPNDDNAILFVLLWRYDLTFAIKDHSLTDWIGSSRNHLGIRGKKLQEAEENRIVMRIQIFLCLAKYYYRNRLAMHVARKETEQRWTAEKIIWRKKSGW